MQRTPRNGTNMTLLAAFGEARVGSCSDFVTTHLVMKLSKDLGESWDRLQVVASMSYTTVGNAAPVWLPKTKILLLPFCANNSRVSLAMIYVYATLT